MRCHRYNHKSKCDKGGYYGKSVARRDTRVRNPVGATKGQIENAKELFRDFRGDHPERLAKVKIRVPKVGVVIGHLDGVDYTTMRDGKTERYRHTFKKSSRPTLAASHDGESLHVLGGEYEFTERGIEDR